jgi:hypothetical protein
MECQASRLSGLEEDVRVWVDLAMPKAPLARRFVERALSRSELPACTRGGRPP